MEEKSIEYVSLTNEQKEKLLDSKVSYIFNQKIAEYESQSRFLSGQEKRKLKREIKRKLSK